MRSRNNNIFRLSSYFNSWSRILFHDHGGRGMEKMREKYDIPKSIKTIEVDVTGEWARVARCNVRCHASDLTTDLLAGTLHQDVVDELEKRLTPKSINAVLHADLLRYIDFDKYNQYSNGGVPLGLIIKDFPTLDQYWVEQRRAGGGPGLLRDDVEEDWRLLSQKWEEELKRVLP